MTASRIFSFGGALLGLALAGLALPAMAQTAGFSSPQVKARLVPAYAKVYPGEETVIGLQQQIIPHWHTYWRNPGDSGTATAIKWTLPPGVAAGDIQWPLPSRFTLGPVTNYGYADEVTLLTPLRVPAAARPGRLPLRAHVSLLVCEEICIPQQADLLLNLDVVAPGTPRGDMSPVIQAAQARLPVASPWPVAAIRDGKALALRMNAPELHGPNVKDVWFYAGEWGKVAHNRPQRLLRESSKAGDTTVIALPPGETPAQLGQPLQGVLVVSEADGKGGVMTRGFDVQATVGAGTIAGTAPVAGPGLAAALLLALVGGLVLNLMPCVFPVLSIKALALLRHADDHAAHRAQGLAYTVGILASFAALACVLIAVKAAGAQVGWGFQFQSPSFVLLTAWLMFAVGLSLSGVFEIGASLAGAGSGLADKKGLAGSFFTGVLAVLVATPCTAPFMGAALGYALAQPPALMLSVFLSLGLGLALPYLAISLWPRLQRLLPRPGAWMERLRQLLAFPMYATAAWLVWVLAQQGGADAVAFALGGMLLLGLAAWLFGGSRGARAPWRRAGTACAVLAIMALVIGTRLLPLALAPAAVAATAHEWTPYTPQALAELRRDGKPAFVNLTAAWCITCLVNERVALNDATVAMTFKQQGIAYLKGDWTNQDPHITQLLSEFGRSGVPLYVFYPASGEPRVLPQILTPDIVIEALRESAAPALASSRH